MDDHYHLLSKKGAWGDQGDGTYVNPVLPGDYSDPDVIRVGMIITASPLPCIAPRGWRCCILRIL